MPTFRFNRHRPTKANLLSEHEGIVVPGQPAWLPSEIRTVDDDTAEWCRSLNTRDFEMFTELSDDGDADQSDAQQDTSGATPPAPPQPEAEGTPAAAESTTGV